MIRIIIGMLETFLDELGKGAGEFEIGRRNKTTQTTTWPEY